MKKYFLFLLMILGVVCNAQRLDTVRVRNLQLPARSYLLCIGQMASSTDSSVLYWVDFIGTKVKQQVPNISQQNWNTTVTIDSIPGEYVFFWYNKYQNTSAKFAREVGNSIYNQIRLVPQFSELIQRQDDESFQDYLRAVKSGKAAGYDN